LPNTTSNSYTFGKTFTIADIIEEAFERVGFPNVSGYQLKAARRSLNILFQEWGNRGIHYWEVGDTNISPVEGQAVYKLYRSAADATAGGSDQATTVNNANSSETVYGLSDISQCEFRTYINNTSGTQADLAMTKIDRSTYAAFSNKLTKSTPTQFWVQRFIDRTTLTIYPTPNSTAAAATSKLHIYFTKRIEDSGDYTNVGQIPYRFVPCMVAGLAFYLSQKYSPQLSQQMKLYYEDELARSLAEDGSASSTYITPKTYYPSD